MEALISDHQIVPGNIIRAVKQRLIGTNHKDNKPNPSEMKNPSAIQIKISDLESLDIYQEKSGKCKRINKKFVSKIDGNYSNSKTEKEDLEEESSDSSGVFSMDLSE